MTATATDSRVAQFTGQGAWQRPPDLAAITEQLLNKAFLDWFEGVKTNDAQAKEYIFDNPNMGITELRAHRLCLHALLAGAEFLIVNFIAFGEQTRRVEEFEDQISLLEKKKAELFKTLIEWHGPIDIQSDIPDSFKQAMREVESGQLEDGGLV